MRLQRITPIINLMVAAAGQYAFDPVLADEEFQLGGLPRGRGYEPAEITGDHGIAGTIELQVRPEFGRDWVDSYQLYAFYDIGAVWQIDARRRPRGQRRVGGLGRPGRPRRGQQLAVARGRGGAAADPRAGQ